MRKILAVFVAALLLFPASAYAVGINYGGTITSIELDGPTVLDGEFAVDQEISGQLIFDDTTGAMSLLSFSDGTRTWAYVDGGRFVETQFFSIPLAPSLDSNDFSASYSFVNPPPTGPTINGHTFTTLLLTYGEFLDPVQNSGADPILSPPALPSLADLIAMASAETSRGGFKGALEFRDIDHPDGINGSIARMRFDINSVTAISPVPLPAPLLLLSAGLIALFGVPRLKRRRVTA